MSAADHIRTTGSAVGIVTGLVATVVFFARLDGRVARLEEQVHTLTATPALSTTAQEVGSPLPQPTANPLERSCADLAKRSADEISKGFQLSSDRIQKTMSDMGCVRSP